MSLTEGAVEIANIDALLRAAEILERELSTRTLDASSTHSPEITSNQVLESHSIENLARIRVRFDCAKLGSESINSMGRISSLQNAVRSFKNQTQLPGVLTDTETQTKPTQWVKMMVDNHQTLKLAPGPNPASVFAGKMLKKRKTAAYAGVGNGLNRDSLSDCTTDNLGFAVPTAAGSVENGLSRGHALTAASGLINAAVRCSMETRLSDYDPDASCFSEFDESYVDSSSQESFAGFNHAVSHSSLDMQNVGLTCDQSEGRLVDASDDNNHISAHHRLRSVLLNSSKDGDHNMTYPVSGDRTATITSSSASSPASSPFPINRSLVISLNPSPPNTPFLYSPSKPPASAPPQLESTSSGQTCQLFGATCDPGHPNCSSPSTLTVTPSLSCLSSPLPADFRQRRSSLPVNSSRLPMKKRKLDWSKMITTQTTSYCDDKTPSPSSLTTFYSPPPVYGSQTVGNGITNMQNGSALIIDCPVAGFSQQPSESSSSAPIAANSQPCDTQQNFAPSRVAVSYHSQIMHTFASTDNTPNGSNLKEHNDGNCTQLCVSTLPECGQGHTVFLMLPTRFQIPVEISEALPVTPAGLLQQRDCTAKNFSLLVQTLTSPFLSTPLPISSSLGGPLVSVSNACRPLTASQKPMREGGYASANGNFHKTSAASIPSSNTHNCQGHYLGVSATTHQTRAPDPLHQCESLMVATDGSLSPSQQLYEADSLHLTESKAVSSAYVVNHRDLELPRGRDHGNQDAGNPSPPWLTTKLRRLDSSARSRTAEDILVSLPCAAQTSFVETTTTSPYLNLFNGRVSVPQVLPPQLASVKKNGSAPAHRLSATTAVIPSTTSNCTNDCVLSVTSSPHYDIPASQTLTNSVWTTTAAQSPSPVSDGTSDNRNPPPGLLNKQTVAGGAQILMMLSPSVLQEHPQLLNTLSSMSNINSNPFNKACSASATTPLTSTAPVTTIGCNPAINMTPGGHLDSSVLHTLNLMKHSNSANRANTAKLTGVSPKLNGSSCNFPILLVSASSSASAAAVAAAAALATGAPASSLIPVPVKLTTTFVPSTTAMTDYTSGGGGGMVCSANSTLASNSDNDSRRLLVSLRPGIEAIEY